MSLHEETLNQISAIRTQIFVRASSLWESIEHLLEGATPRATPRDTQKRPETRRNKTMFGVLFVCKTFLLSNGLHFHDHTNTLIFTCFCILPIPHSSSSPHTRPVCLAPPCLSLSKMYCIAWTAYNVNNIERNYLLATDFFCSFISLYVKRWIITQNKWNSGMRIFDDVGVMNGRLFLGSPHS